MRQLFEAVAMAGAMLVVYLTKQGIISPKLQLLSGHTTEQSLAVYRELALSDVAEEYEVAMQRFPVR